MAKIGKQTGWGTESDVAMKHIELCITKLNSAKHDISTGVDLKHVVFQLKDEITKALQNLSDYTERV